MTTEHAPTYAHMDEDGDRLEVRPSSMGDGRSLLTVFTSSVVLPAEELPALVAGLYRAAGQEPPIILARPTNENDVRKYWVEGGKVRVLQKPSGFLTPEEARLCAAVYAAAADLAEDAPDPQQIAAIVALVDGVGVGPNVGERIARALVAAGWRREAAADE